MHHSFFHHRIRVDVELRESSGVWDWTCRFDHGSIIPLQSEKSENCKSAALQMACQTARWALDQHNESLRLNMTDQYLSLHVEASSSCINKYFWVITERPTPDLPVEVAASLQFYDKPSDAYRAGKSVLHSLATGKSQQSGRNLSLYSSASSRLSAARSTLH